MPISEALQVHRNSAYRLLLHRYMATFVTVGRRYLCCQRRGMWLVLPVERIKRLIVRYKHRDCRERHGD